MNTLSLRVELLKARRSKVPLLTALGFSLAPLMGGLFMVILKDPGFARNAGLLRTKAQLLSGPADWPTYFGLLAQSTAVGGILVFALITSWVFGREFVDGTVRNFLSLPTSRSSLITAKFIVSAFLCALLVILNFLLGNIVGLLVGLPALSASILLQGARTIGVTAILTISLISPIALFASTGRGYLAPMGFAIIVLVLSQVLSAAGWGPLFPWAVPALYSGLGEQPLEVLSYVLVLTTSASGLIATFVWWRLADQQ
jgi:ABC-2 type transport system permease protein